MQLTINVPSDLADTINRVSKELGPNWLENLIIKSLRNVEMTHWQIDAERNYAQIKPKPKELLNRR